MDKYLIHIGLQDKPGLLWQAVLFDFSYRIYADMEKYDLRFSIAHDGDAPLSTAATALLQCVPGFDVPDRTNMGAKPFVMFNKLAPTITNLRGRHLIVMDSDIILLPEFNRHFILRPGEHFAFEPNTIHVGGMNNAAKLVSTFSPLSPAECYKLPAAPSWIAEAGIAEHFVGELVASIQHILTHSSANALAHAGGHMLSMYLPPILAKQLELTTRQLPHFSGNHPVYFPFKSVEGIYGHATNMHYWAVGFEFDKRNYTTRTPFHDTPPVHVSSPATRLIWNMISECRDDRRYKNFMEVCDAHATCA